jgi:hypothetical protein
MPAPTWFALHFHTACPPARTSWSGGPESASTHWPRWSCGDPSSTQNSWSVRLRRTMVMSLTIVSEMRERPAAASVVLYPTERGIIQTFWHYHRGLWELCGVSGPWLLDLEGGDRMWCLLPSSQARTCAKRRGCYLYTNRMTYILASALPARKSVWRLACSSCGSPILQYLLSPMLHLDILHLHLHREKHHVFMTSILALSRKISYDEAMRQLQNPVLSGLDSPSPGALHTTQNDGARGRLKRWHPTKHRHSRFPLKRS